MFNLPSSVTVSMSVQAHCDLLRLIHQCPATDNDINNAANKYSNNQTITVEKTSQAAGVYNQYTRVPGVNWEGCDTKASSIKSYREVGICSHSVWRSFNMVRWHANQKTWGQDWHRVSHPVPILSSSLVPQAVVPILSSSLVPQAVPPRSHIKIQNGRLFWCRLPTLSWKKDHKTSLFVVCLQEEDTIDIWKNRHAKDQSWCNHHDHIGLLRHSSPTATSNSTPPHADVAQLYDSTSGSSVTTHHKPTDIMRWYVKWPLCQTTLGTNLIRDHDIFREIGLLPWKTPISVFPWNSVKSVIFCEF